MIFLAPRFDPTLVAASLLIATLSAYVMLDFARRGRSVDHRMAQALLGLASLAMGTGIWSMHFVGMLAFSLPIALGYTQSMTALSWLASVLACFVALRIAASEPSLPRLAGGALAMGGGISAMHYLGMAALVMTPAIVWDMALVAISVLIAIAASTAALLIFFWLRGRAGSSLLRQLLAALVMGLAASSMHYTGMLAAQFPQGSVCLSADALGGKDLGALALLASAAMLLTTLLLSALDARMQHLTQRLAESLRSANGRLRQANDTLRRQTLHDGLTGLPNRLAIEAQLQGIAAAADKSPPRVAALFIDLDCLRRVNEVFGHGCGDLLLKDVVARLIAAAGRRDTIARIAGDGFLLLTDEDVDPAACTALAGRLIAALERPFDVGGRELALSASIGISICPDHGRLADLLVQADAAMAAAKRMGGGTSLVFEPDMEGLATDEIDLHNDLRHAIENGELSLHYQPKIDGRRGQIVGVEALLRWQHPRRGAVGPARFIPIAERFGLIVPLGNWVVDEACRQVRAWADAGLRLPVAINVSAPQLRRSDFVDHVRQALDRHRLAPSMLLCEITESVAMEDVQGTQRAIEALQQNGVYLAIDDFGTGYSSLAYLRQLPARQLKIDRSFVGDIETSADAQAIVEAVIRLAHALGLSVVAEGVETAAQRDALLRPGCDELQGYYFAKPMPAAALLAWARGHKPQGAVDFVPSALDEALAV